MRRQLGDEAEGDGPVTLTWWHNATDGPAQGVWQKVADDYHKAHPDVTFKVEPLQNEQFTTKIPVGAAVERPAGHLPAVGRRRAGHAGHVRQGQDITGATSVDQADRRPRPQGWQVDGKQYGVPYSLGIVGFWYRKDLFEQGRASPRRRDHGRAERRRRKLKAAGITPIAVGGKDRWPDAFYWDYFAIRECSTDTLKQAVKDVKLDDPCFMKAGEDLKTSSPPSRSRRASSARPPSRAPAARPAWSPTARPRWSCRATGSRA